MPTNRIVPLGLPIELENHPLQQLFQQSGRRLTPATFHQSLRHPPPGGRHPLLSLYTILGHSSISITQQYLRHRRRPPPPQLQNSPPLIPHSRTTADGFPYHDFQKLAHAAKNDEERAIFRLFYATGSQQIWELFNLKNVDINRSDGKIFVRQGKFNNRYLLVDNLTLAQLPEEFSVNSATPMAEMIKEAAQKAGLFRQYDTVSPHSFRRSFATGCYLNGHPPGHPETAARPRKTRVHPHLPRHSGHLHSGRI